MRGLLSEEATYNALDAQLKENLSLVKAAEERAETETEEQEVEMDREMTHGL
ncbi:hypothetical protein [Sulfitobacter profundi]|uniref:Uncharacterized protein n=1 Tax=Sulfitobacter profundi TaxID=2679961 RepID=A0ABW1YYR2_9RHOB